LKNGILILTLFLLACANYSSTTRGRGVRGDLDLPLFVNETDQAGLGIELTELLLEEIERDGLLHKVPEEGDPLFRLDVILESYEEKAAFTGEMGAAEEYTLEIQLKLTLSTLRDPHEEEEGREDFSKSIRARETFYLEGEGFSRDDALENAKEQLVDDILLAIFGDW
jgi:hypothetical protein